MKQIVLSTLFAVLLSSTGWAYTANDALKTIVSDGSPTDTNAAVAYVKTKAQDGWVLTIGTAGGAYTWLTSEVTDVTFDVPYNFTVQGASPTNRPTITHGSSCLWRCTAGKLLTVKDLIFVAGEGRSVYQSISGSGPTPVFRFTNIRWEGNFAMASGVLGLIGTPGGNGGEPYGTEGPFGVIDNCVGTGHTSFVIYGNNHPTNSKAASPAWRLPMEWGSQKAVYVEDSEFYADGSHGFGWGVIDAYNGSHVVFRNNRLENCIATNHGADHFDNHVKSAVKHEIYDNEFHLTAGISAPWLMFFRGGTAAIYDNTYHIDPTGYAAIGVKWDYYRSAPGTGQSNSILDRFYGALNTTIASGSNGVDLANTFTVNVADTNINPAYGGSGTVIEGPVYTRLAAGSNGVTLTYDAAVPGGGEIHLVDATDFPSAGTIRIGTPAVPTSPNSLTANQYHQYDYSPINYTGKSGNTLTGCVAYSDLTISTGDIVAGVGAGEGWKFSSFIENIQITTSAGVQTVRATGKTATSFTGVLGGTGTMSTGGAVTRASDYPGTQQPGMGPIVNRIAAGSNGATLPQATIHVEDTSHFPSSGTLLVNYDHTTPTGTGTTVTYTGKTATTFTGCTGGTGTMTTGNLVGGIGQDPRWPNEPWGLMPIWQWNNGTAPGSSIGQLTSWNAGDFINDGRDLYAEDAETTKPTATGTWLDTYTALAYPHPLNDFVEVTSEATATTINAGTVTIGTN